MNVSDSLKLHSKFQLFFNRLRTMNALNKAQIIGNLTREPELKQTAGGQSVCTFGVATNRSWTDSNGTKKDEAEYHNIVAWGKLAEICGQYLKRGTKVFVEGRLQTRNWEDEGGIKHYRTEIVSNDMIILTPKGENTGGGNYGGNEPAPAAPVPQTASPAVDDISPEDLPF